MNVRRPIQKAHSFCPVLTNLKFSQYILDKPLKTQKFHKNSPVKAELFHVD